MVDLLNQLIGALVLPANNWNSFLNSHIRVTTTLGGPPLLPPLILLIIVGQVLFKNVQDSTNTRDLDKKIVQMPRTQPGYMGKISVHVVVLIFLFTIQNVNIKIKTTTENLPTQAGCVPGIPTDFLSKSLVFVESCTILWVDTSYLLPSQA